MVALTWLVLVLSEKEIQSTTMFQIVEIQAAILIQIARHNYERRKKDNASSYICIGKYNK